MNPEQLASQLARTLEDAKAENVRVYDVRGKSGLTDFFVVATGAAAPHLKALVRLLPKAYRLSGAPESGWIVADYFDVVVHVFSAEARAYYALEKLWMGDSAAGEKAS
ncbi:MAG: ribosome silencing factor [Kiritimatiellae bacterium]|nr:ribosome silencing factor [Kiritimatiellia bacterium]